MQDDNNRFFDHRREHARTDWDNNGLPRPEWEDLLREMRRRADAAGHLRFGLPKEFGGADGSNLAMAVIREHLGHVKSLADHVAQEMKAKHGVGALGSEGADAAEWVLVDFDSVVLHVMQPPIREFYDLERLWERRGRGADEESAH